MAYPRRFFVRAGDANMLHLNEVESDSDQEAFGGSDDEPEYDGGQTIIEIAVLDGVFSDDPPPRVMRGTVMSKYAKF